MQGDMKRFEIQTGKCLTSRTGQENTPRREDQRKKQREPMTIVTWESFGRFFSDPGPAHIFPSHEERAEDLTGRDLHICI